MTTRLRSSFRHPDDIGQYSVPTAVPVSSIRLSKAQARLLRSVFDWGGHLYCSHRDPTDG